jgi:type 1 glutamine amidotransferase
MRRRSFLAAAPAAAAALHSANPLLAEKSPGETRVIFLVGDYWHNPITQEKNWRNVLYPTGWRLLFAQATRFVTPEALGMADLFVVSRYAKANNLGFSPDMFAEDRLPEEQFLTMEREAAIIENVERGMGLLAMHCTIWNGDNENFMNLLGVEKPYMHTPVQPALMHELNQEHQITKDIEKQNMGRDEIFYADLIPGHSEVLYNLKGEEHPTNRAGGWCHEHGNGRVVVNLPGHTPHPFHTKAFKQVMWNSAHWAMGLDIPEHSFEDGRPPEDLT